MRTLALFLSFTVSALALIGGLSRSQTACYKDCIRQITARWAANESVCNDGAITKAICLCKIEDFKQEIEVCKIVTCGIPFDVAPSTCGLSGDEFFIVGGADLDGQREKEEMEKVRNGTPLSKLKQHVSEW